VKDKATVCFRRLKTCEVIGEIIKDAGEIVVSRNFGEMTANEFRGILDVIKREYPDLGADAPIEVTEN
jgi:hypothetical protein